MSSSAERSPGASPVDPSINLVVRDLTVVYPNGHVALRDAGLALAPGTICGLVGMNGSGKSTLFKAIMGFVTPARGTISIGGQAPEQARRRSLVAYVPQAEDVDWAFPVSVWDVVLMGRYGHMGFLRIPRAPDRALAREALERVGMAEYRDRQIGELSGGQKKRVFLARALAQQGRILLLDEPFTGVDVTTERQITDLLRQLRDQGQVILVSTHNLGSVPEFCDQVVILNRTVLAAGPTRAIFTRENLIRAFGGTLRHLRVDHTDVPGADANELVVLTDDERALIVDPAGQVSGYPRTDDSPDERPRA